MDITIIICTFNRAELLRACLQSVVRASVPDSVSREILVIDNNSSDETAAVIRAYSVQSDAGCRYFFESTQGKSFALNRGIREANGEVIAFLDDDMIVDHGWLTAIADAVRKHPEAAGFGGRVLIDWPVERPDWILTEGPYRNIDGTLGYRDCGEKDCDFTELQTLPTGGNMFLRREVFESGNSFREDLGPSGNRMIYGEDQELCRRLAEQGEKLYYVSRALAYHKIPASKLSRKYFYKRRFECAYHDAKYQKGVRARSIVMGIPNYLFKMLVGNFIKILTSPNQAARFFYRLKHASLMGQIAGYAGKRSGKVRGPGAKRKAISFSECRYELQLGFSYVMNSCAWHLWRKGTFVKTWENDRHRWVFIMGCNDSGTSLLYNILGSHPEIGKVASESANESGFFPSYVTNVLPSSLKLGVDRAWSEKPDIFHLTEASNHLDGDRIRYDWLNIVKVKGRGSRPYLIEKTTENAFRSRWLQKVFPDSYFIGIVRDGYAVAEGLRRNSGYTFERCARHWNQVNKVMMEDSKYLRRFKFIKYEDLTERPQETLSEIAAFLGIEKEPLMHLAEEEWNTQNIHNPTMKRFMPIQNMNASSMQRLTEDDCDHISREAHEMLKIHGYFDKNSSSCQKRIDRPVAI